MSGAANSAAPSATRMRQPPLREEQGPVNFNRSNPRPVKMVVARPSAAAVSSSSASASYLTG
jgi:hypothetical protein